MQACSSFIFPQIDESELSDILQEISNLYYEFFVYVLFYVGPICVLLNIFAIFILTRREVRTPYNIIFIAMALDQSLAILGKNILLWESFFDLGCGLTESFAYELFEGIVNILCPMLNAHALWLAVIVTFVRLRHLSSSSEGPSFRDMNVLCSLSFVILFLIGIPHFLTFDIYWGKIYSTCDRSEGLAQPSGLIFNPDSDRNYVNDCLLLRITNISNGIMYNALPCILLMLLSVALTYRLRKIRKIHEDTMMGRSSAVKYEIAESVRSSWMIAMIVFTTLTTGVPQAIANIFVGFMSEIVGSIVSTELSALLITLVIISSAINIIIYLSMSRRIREVTLSYLCCACRSANNTSSRVVSSSNQSKMYSKHSVSVIAR